MPFPELFRDDVFRVETTRLWLRWPRAGDARALHQIAEVAAVAEMTATWPHPLPETEADWRILRARESNAEGRSVVLAITRKKAPNQLIGLVGVFDTDEHGLQLWYLVEPQWQGRGLATEAVAGLVGAVFTGSGYSRIRSSSRTVNPASRRVLEKAGFDHVGTALDKAPARGGPVEVDNFVLSRAAWRNAMTQARAQGFGPARAA